MDGGELHTRVCGILDLPELRMCINIFTYANAMFDSARELLFRLVEGDIILCVLLPQEHRDTNKSTHILIDSDNAYNSVCRKNSLGNIFFIYFSINIARQYL